MAYNVSNAYKQAIYSQDDKNDLKIWFNNVELQDASVKCEKITRIARILPDDGSQRFSLNNFISTNVEVVLHNVSVQSIVDQVKISIGTLVSANTYEYVPLGMFNIQEIQENDKNTITLKLRDNRVKFDFNYNAQPLIESLGGQATKKQILDDICTKAGVTNTISSFNGDSDLVGIYDSSIQATTYVGYLMEQAGLVPVIDRLGQLKAIDLSDLETWEIPLSLVESNYKVGTPYGIDRVCYESGIIKYETSNDETLDTLYIDSANPYISSQDQINYIYNKLKNFEIDSVITKKVFGNPAIDPYDLIQVYNDIDNSNDVVFTTLANTTYTYNGVHRDNFDTQIGVEKRTENVSKNSEQTFRNYAKTNIDNLNAEVEIIAGKTQIVSNELFGVGTITLENAHEGHLHRLEINGNIRCLFPSSELYPSETLYPRDTYLIVDSDRYHLDFTYLNYMNSDVYDKWICEDGKQWVERNVGIDQYGDMYALDDPIIEEKEDLVIDIKEDSVITMESFSNAILRCIYLLENEYTNNFATIVDVNSEIKVQADRITQTVQQVADDDGNITSASIILAVNNDESAAEIKANKINLNGIVTANNNFKILEDGSMETKNGKFTGEINGGAVRISGDYSERDPYIYVESPNSTSLEPINTNIWSDGISCINYGEGIPSIRTEKSDGYAELAGSQVNAFGFNNVSLAERKENIEKFNNALKVIDDIDIYKYNYKGERENAKKHIGLVIGKDYKYSKEVTSINNEEIDLYSLISVCCQAIKEQQQIINDLNNRLKVIEEKESE